MRVLSRGDSGTWWKGATPLLVMIAHPHRVAIRDSSYPYEVEARGDKELVDEHYQLLPEHLICMLPCPEELTTSQTQALVSLFY